MTGHNHGKFGARAFSRRTAVSGAAAGAITLLGASRATAAPRITFPGSSALQDETPVSGGTLRYGLSTDPSNFEPHVSTGAASSSVKQMVYSTLLTYDTDQQLTGDLAEEFGWVDDLSYQVKVREGVTFHDGSDLTVDDVVFSLQRIQNPDTAATNASFFRNVTDIAAGDGNTVLLTFSAPYAAFPYILANSSSLIVSKAWIESGVDPMTTMMGTGPFTFGEWLPGISITVAKNPNYYVADLPYLDAIVFQPMADDPTRVSNLQSGAVDFIDYVPYTQMTALSEDPNFIFASDSNIGFNWLGFNHEMEMANDVNVRRAFALGLDREALAEVAFAGHGSAITGGLIPEGVIGYSPDLEGMFNPDYEQAKALLVESGYDTLDIPLLSTSTYTVISRPAEAAQAQLQEANINAELELQEWLTFRQSVADGTHPSHVWGTSYGYPDPDFLYDYMHSSGTQAGWFRFADEQLDAWLEEGRSSTDEALRGEIYNSVQTRAAEIVPWIYMIRRTQGEAMATRVKGYTHSETWSTIHLRETWLDG